jgi:hypothetical protein
VIRLSRDPTPRTWRGGDGRLGGDGGRVSHTPARPQTTREGEMSLFGRHNARPRAKSL